jgi:hypothetical protein
MVVEHLESLNCQTFNFSLLKCNLQTKRRDIQPAKDMSCRLCVKCYVDDTCRHDVHDDEIFVR